LPQLPGVGEEVGEDVAADGPRHPADGAGEDDVGPAQGGGDTVHARHRQVHPPHAGRGDVRRDGEAAVALRPGGVLRREVAVRHGPGLDGGERPGEVGGEAGGVTAGEQQPARGGEGHAGDATARGHRASSRARTSSSRRPAVSTSAVPNVRAPACCHSSAPNARRKGRARSLTDPVTPKWASSALDVSPPLYGLSRPFALATDHATAAAAVLAFDRRRNTAGWVSAARASTRRQAVRTSTSNSSSA